MLLMLYSPLDTALFLVLLQPDAGDGYFLLCSSKSSFRGTTTKWLMRRGSVWCGVAHMVRRGSGGAAWLSLVRRGSLPRGVAQLLVRRGSVDRCGVAQLVVRRASVDWCGVSRLVARWLAVRQARVRFSARHHREVFPHWAYKRWGNGERPQRMAKDKCIEWMWLNECMYVCYKKRKINKKSGILPPNLF